MDLETVLHVSNAFEWTPKEPRWKYRDMWSRSFFSDTLRGIAVGVRFLHTKLLIVHRDLKPANVLMKRQDDGSLIPKICDFGMSKVCRHGDIVQNAKVVGTKEYMPYMDFGSGYNTQYIPEKFDAYSFGMMAWEMWTRVKPFSEFAEPIEWRIKVCKEAFRPPTTSDESGAVMIPMYGNKNTPASLKWKNVRLVGVRFPPKLLGLIEGCWAQRCEDRWAFGKIVSEMGDKRLLSGGSGWFDNDNDDDDDDEDIGAHLSRTGKALLRTALSDADRTKTTKKMMVEISAGGNKGVAHKTNVGPPPLPAWPPTASAGK